MHTKTTQVSVTDIFHSIQTPYLVIAADYPALTIIEENDAHAKIAMVQRKAILGKPFLEVFPDTSKEYEQTGRSIVTESIRSVIRTGKADAMPDIQYDIKDENGNFVERFWAATHYPIFDENGTVSAVYQETKDITGEKNISNQLVRAQRQLEHVLNLSQVGTWAWDIKNNIVTTDKNLAKMFGVSSQKAATGLELSVFINSIYSDDQERVQAAIEHSIAEGNPYEVEYRTNTATGEVRWVIARGFVQYDANKAAETFSGTIIDITERKEAERALYESEERLRFMADSMPQLVWITRPDGFHEYYNKQWYTYTGTQEGSTDGEGWNDLFHPEDQPRAWKKWKHSLATGEPYEIEYRLYNKESDGYRWVIGRALPLRDSDGKIIKWYGTCTDIDEQKHSVEMLKFLADVSTKLAATLDYNKMLRNVTRLCVPTIADWCTIDMYDEEHGFTQVSLAHVDPKKIDVAKEYRKHNPISKDDPTGVANVLRTGKSELYEINDALLEAYIKDADKLAYMKSLRLNSIMFVPIRIENTVRGAMTFATSESGRHLEANDQRVIEDLSRRISLAMTNSKLYADTVEDSKHLQKLEKELRLEKQKLESRVKERTQQLQLTNEGLRDEISKRQNVERELQEFSKELTRSNGELENFAYVASHDLQEPLRKIQAFGNLLLSEYGDSLGEDGADYLSRMHSAANRMSTLIDDLLTFSRVTRKTTARKSVDLNIVASEVISDIETRITDTNAVVKIGKLPTVSADPTHMRQLLQNLIGNAIKFHQPDVQPIVEVRSRAKAGGYEIKVIDNGVGFDEKYLDRIFSVFQRLHDRSTYEGTGIGLAVCRKIAEKYNGTITAKSKKNEGSTFIVWLPTVEGKTAR